MQMETFKIEGNLLGVELNIPADGELGSMLDSWAVLVGVAPP